MNEYENDDRIYCISLVDDIVVDWYRLVNNLVKRTFEMEKKRGNNVVYLYAHMDMIRVVLDNRLMANAQKVQGLALPAMEDCPFDSINRSSLNEGFLLLVIKMDMDKFEDRSVVVEMALRKVFEDNVLSESSLLSINPSDSMIDYSNSLFADIPVSALL